MSAANIKVRLTTAIQTSTRRSTPRSSFTFLGLSRHLFVTILTKETYCLANNLSRDTDVYMPTDLCFSSASCPDEGTAGEWCWKFGQRLGGKYPVKKKWKRGELRVGKLSQRTRYKHIHLKPPNCGGSVGGHVWGRECHRPPRHDLTSASFFVLIIRRNDGFICRFLKIAFTRNFFLSFWYTNTNR